MEENTIKIIKERFDSLPENIQEFILSDFYEETLAVLGQECQLDAEKKAIMERETTMVMMGLTNQHDFETNLTRELSINKSLVTKLVKDINEKIFSRFLELLEIMNTPAEQVLDTSEDNKERLEILNKISSKYGLNEKQREVLRTETNLVLLGKRSLIEYEETLTTDFGLSKSTADKMLAEIDQLVLKELRPELNTAFDANARGEEVPELTSTGDRRFKNLPPEIKKIVENSNYQGLLYTIGRSKGLNVEQLGILEENTVDLITGKTHPEDFGKALTKDLAIDGGKITELVTEINEKIFKKIREGLMAGGMKQETVPPVRPPAPPAPLPTIAKEDHAVLNKAGIEIVEQSANIGALDKLELESPQTIKNEVHPILAQKLSGYVQNDVVETQHSMDNIPKKESPVTPMPTMPTTPPPAPKPASYPPRQDPYRLPPE